MVRDDAEERYISYEFLRQSCNQHGNLKQDLQNDFTTSDNRYPKNRQQTLHLLISTARLLSPKCPSLRAPLSFKIVAREVDAMVRVEKARMILSIRNYGRTRPDSSVRINSIPHISALRKRQEVARTMTTNLWQVLPAASRSLRRTCVT